MPTETATPSESGDGVPMTVSGVTIGTENGGDLELIADKPMEAPGGLQLTATGAAFGPLEISAYPGSSARVGGLTFLEERSFIDTLFGSDAGPGHFGSLAAVGSAKTDRDETATRRDVLKALSLGGAVAVSTHTAAAATENATAHKAQFESVANPAGLRVRVFDSVEGVLPPNETYYTFVNGQDYSRFSAASDDSYGDVLPEQVGTITVGPEGAGGGFFAALRADKTVVYDGLGLSNSTSNAQTGDELVISDNDILVEAVSSAGASDTMLELNGTSIPHRAEDVASERGYYGVSDDRLVYTVGTNPPSAASATLTVYADLSDELLDDASRRLD